MSLHKANSTQIAANFAGISITRNPKGYESLAHTMRVGLWIRCSDGVERPVAWALVDDKDVIETVTDLCRRSWFAMLDILDGYQDIVTDVCSHAVNKYSRLTREMREECMDYNEYIPIRSHVRNIKDALKRISSETLARCYSALGVRYEWWMSETGEEAMVPRLTEADDISPSALRLPMLVWNPNTRGSIENFIGTELEPIMYTSSETRALEELNDLIIQPDYKTAWDYDARDILSWPGDDKHLTRWKCQTNFELV